MKRPTRKRNPVTPPLSTPRRSPLHETTATRACHGCHGVYRKTAGVGAAVGAIASQWNATAIGVIAAIVVIPRAIPAIDAGARCVGTECGAWAQVGVCGCEGWVPGPPDRWGRTTAMRKSEGHDGRGEGFGVSTSGAVFRHHRLAAPHVHHPPCQPHQH